MVDDILAVPAALEKHFAVHGAKAEDVRTYLGHKVYLADGGMHEDARHIKGLSEEDEWMKRGYYMAVWGVMVGKAVWGRPAYFQLNHSPELNKKDKKWSRLNSAMADARDYIEIGVRAGLLPNKSIIALPTKGLH